MISFNYVYNNDKTIFININIYFILLINYILNYILETVA
mgnify:CR=1 FL=1|jgi:hypothetical protein